MNPKTKKNIYVALWLILGALWGLILGELAELVLLQTNHNEVLENKIIMYSLLIVLGVAFGFLLGPIAWRKIYVEGLRGKKYVVKGGK